MAEPVEARDFYFLIHPSTSSGNGKKNSPFGKLRDQIPVAEPVEARDFYFLIHPSASSGTGKKNSPFGKLRGRKGEIDQGPISGG
jgi:hypothetical protein